MIGIIGDMHFKERLGYSDYIDDGRVAEKEKVLDFIVATFEKCDQIVFMGDQLNSKNNPSQVIKDFVRFLERFKTQEIFIIAGNHEKFGSGKSAIDFLKEIKNERWHVITNKIEIFNNMVFCPYFTKSELGFESNKEVADKLTDLFINGNVLFIHHAISGTDSINDYSVDLFDEPVFDRKKLEEKFNWVIGGHIHKPQVKGHTIVTGSIFNNEVGEHEKYIWKLNLIDPDTSEFFQIKVSDRGIYKLENPSIEDLKKIGNGNIVKVVITNDEAKENIESLKEEMERFDGHLILEHIQKERQKTKIKEGTDLLDLDIIQLLEIYAKEKKVDFSKLKSGFDLINSQI